MTDLIYEQPLNEKIRSYLRLENLSRQLQNNTQQDQHHQCFYPLFSLAELTERCDYRGEVLKDIDRQIQQLTQISCLAGSDSEQVDQIIQQLNSLKLPLLTPQRIGCDLKQDKFITALRQRFNMTGAPCNFDLPQLHFWLGQPWEQRQQDIQNWLAQFEPLLAPILLLLELCRKSAEFSQMHAKAGFYHGDTQQALSLIRVKINASQHCYPTISGHKNRYAIHFVDFNLHRHTSSTIEFSLATCS
ncbi:cell division protein ZapD [Shewanella inventionis]|uniref:cell division protein ZapD n=1 Tax=Shewanella inventionis TaxID=1738770 RepID=UPI001CBCF5D5|nr:cell division protein ZapD [Shewanella inventionis]UAL44026.1 cell division protein ZapD [Shewanella inventionis]